MDSDSEDEAALRFFHAPGGHAIDENGVENIQDFQQAAAVPVGRTRQDNLKAMRLKRWGDNPKERKITVREKKKAGTDKDLEKLIPEVLPQSLQFAKTDKKDTGVKISAAAICSSAFGATNTESLRDVNFVAATNSVSTTTTERAQVFMSDLIATRTGRHIDERMESLNQDDFPCVKFVWDEASLRTSFDLEALRKLFGLVANDFIERPSVLPNGRSRQA